MVRLFPVLDADIITTSMLTIARNEIPVGHVIIQNAKPRGMKISIRVSYPTILPHPAVKVKELDCYQAP